MGYRCYTIGAGTAAGRGDPPFLGEVRSACDASERNATCRRRGHSRCTCSSRALHIAEALLEEGLTPKWWATPGFAEGARRWRHRGALGRATRAHLLGVLLRLPRIGPCPPSRASAAIWATTRNRKRWRQR